MDPGLRTPRPLRRASGILKRGGVVALPTDTCFGLAGDALRPETVARVLTIKGRGGDRPPSVFVPDMEAIPRIALFTPATRAMTASLLPGPWTVLLPSHGGTPAWLVSPEGLVGIRWTRFHLVADILSATGLLLTATSANATGLPPPYDPAALARVLDPETVDLIIEAPCGGLPPSTVVDLSTTPPRIRRAAGDVAMPHEEALHEDRHRG